VHATPPSLVDVWHLRCESLHPTSGCTIALTLLYTQNQLGDVPPAFVRNSRRRVWLLNSSVLTPSASQHRSSLPPSVFFPRARSISP